jgi:hypothetical protein
VTFSQPNGSYTFSVEGPGGYGITPQAGQLSVAGADTSISISFAATNATYTVAVSETGLPAGTEWNATLGGTSNSTQSTRVLFSMPNGTYEMSVGSVPGYSANFSDSVTVDGRSVATGVTFSPMIYAAHFFESGLPTGDSWTVVATNVVGGGTITGHSDSGELTLNFASGIYQIEATGPVGYLAALSESTLQITGSGAPALSITFAPVGHVSSSSNGFQWFTIGVLVATGLVASASAALGLARYRNARLRSEAQGWVRMVHNNSIPEDDQVRRQ